MGDKEGLNSHLLHIIFYQACQNYSDLRFNAFFARLSYVHHVFCHMQKWPKNNVAI